MGELSIMNVPQAPRWKLNGRSPRGFNVHSETTEIWNKWYSKRISIYFKCTCRIKSKPPKIIASPFNIVEQDPKASVCSSITAFSSINLPSALKINGVLSWTKSKWSCSVLNSQKSPVKPSKQEHSKILWGFNMIRFTKRTILKIPYETDLNISRESGRARSTVLTGISFASVFCFSILLAALAGLTITYFINIGRNISIAETNFTDFINTS